MSDTNRRRGGGVPSVARASGSRDTIMSGKGRIVHTAHWAASQIARASRLGRRGQSERAVGQAAGGAALEWVARAIRGRAVLLHRTGRYEDAVAGYDSLVRLIDQASPAAVLELMATGQAAELLADALADKARALLQLERPRRSTHSAGRSASTIRSLGESGPAD